MSVGWDTGLVFCETFKHWFIYSCDWNHDRYLRLSCQRESAICYFESSNLVHEWKLRLDKLWKTLK